MVEPGGPEGVVRSSGSSAFVLAEHDALEDRAPLSRQPGRDASREPRPDAVGVAADPAAVTDDPPVACQDDDVDAVPAEPRSLVEAVARPAAATAAARELEQRALRRRAAEREVEQHGLAQRQRAEARQPRRNAQIEARRRAPGR